MLFFRFFSSFYIYFARILPAKERPFVYLAKSAQAWGAEQTSITHELDVFGAL